MIRIVLYLFTGIIASCYYFSFGFTFLPSSINTKMILAVVGVCLFGYNVLQQGAFKINRPLLIATVLAAVFSLICFFAADFNNTVDYSYATYIISYFTWLGGAYTVCALIRAVHGEANFRLVTVYLAVVCFSQCIFALLIDNISSFQLFVDSYIAQGQAFYTEVERLYGIGAALDGAGIRFSLVLIMIVALFCKDEAIRENNVSIIVLLVCFFFIAVVGNIISRTTILGLIAAIIYFLLSSGLFRMRVPLTSLRLGVLFAIVLIIAVVITTILYQTNAAFHEHIRFAFEGFFNWIENGEWRTDSTDKLNRHMWVWPSDLKTWIIGAGKFNNWAFDTDIGYCRFILYCGLIGFSTFAFFFVYNAAVFGFKHKEYAFMFFVFMLLTFAVWIKVSTDIYQIYALFYCLDNFNTAKDLRTENDENRLLYTGNV